MSESARKNSFRLLIALIFIIMLALNWLTPFAADDYFYAFSFATGERMVSLRQLLPSLAAHGQEMNGRYAPHFFVQLFTMLPNRLFDLCNAAMFVLFILGLYQLVRGEKRYDLTLLILLAAGIFLCPPDFGGPMLWLSGSLNYLWCGTAALWLIKPCADVLVRGKAAPPKWIVALIALGGLWAGNGSENLSATLALMLFGCALWQRLKAKRGYLWMLLVAGATLAGWLLLVLAPGDSDRLSGIASSGLGYYMEHLLTALERWRDALMPLSLIYLIALAFGVSQKLPKERLWFSGLLAFSAFLCNGVMAISFYYPLRTVFWPVMLMTAACGMLAAPLITQSKALWLGASYAAAFMMALALCAALCSDYNRYCQFNARTADILIQQSLGETDIVTYSVSGQSKYDMFNDLVELTTEGDYRTNAAMAKYYNVNTIVAERFE